MVLGNGNYFEKRFQVRTIVECLSDSYQISQYFGGSLEEFLVSNCAECQESQQVLQNLSNTSQLIEVRLRRSLLKR